MTSILLLLSIFAKCKKISCPPKGTSNHVRRFTFVIVIYGQIALTQINAFCCCLLPFNAVWFDAVYRRLTQFNAYYYRVTQKDAESSKVAKDAV